MSLGKICDRIADEPFRLFFPWGVVLALMGVLYWPLNLYHIAFTSFPIDFHVWLQIYGFLWSFIVGFLATALPRLTETPHFSRREVGILFLLSLGIVSALCTSHIVWAHGFFTVALLVFVAQLAKRFVRRKKTPPATFIFIPFAFVSALLGSSMTIALQRGWNWHFEEVTILARSLATLGFTSFLILGVGGFLIRSILGWGQPLPVSAQERMGTMPANKISAVVLHGFVGLGIFASFVLDAFLITQWALVLRAVLISFELVTQIKIHKWPQSGKITSVFLLVSLWLFLAGIWGTVFCPPDFRLAFLHLCFIGGFSLSVFSVATRVILSHCGFSKLLNGSYRPFSIAGTFILLGLLARFSANFLPESYELHLAFGALAWVVGVLVWSFFILGKSIKDTLRAS